MAKRAGWMIYGANGYAGQLVAVEATRRGLNPVLGGRRAGPIERLAAELNLRRGSLILEMQRRSRGARGHGNRGELRRQVPAPQGPWSNLFDSATASAGYGGMA